ncbi:hypothetical protein V6Z11_A06G162200 [Gossypium hirsutum]
MTAFEGVSRNEVGVLNSNSYKRGLNWNKKQR